MKLLLLVFLSVLSSTCFAATITGTVTDEKGAPLAYASISVKGGTEGVVANSGGRYSINLREGSYILQCRHIGYKTDEKTVHVGGQDQLLDFRLQEQDFKMQEVVIKRGEDPALEIMRKTIAKREYYNRQTDSLTVEVYIKGLLRSQQMPDRFLGQKVEKDDFKKQGLDSIGKGILFLSESVTKVAFKRPDKIKYEVLSSRVSGGEGLGFSFPFFVSFYNSNVQLFSNNVNPRGFVSPLADGAFHYYQFRFDGSFFEGGKMIDQIRVTPRRRQEPLFEGWLQIVDGEWRLHSLNLLTHKNQGLDLLDSIRVTQLHTEVAPDVYKTANQVISLSGKFFGFGVSGDFLNVYSHYDLNPGFRKNFFNRTLMRYDTAYNKKDSSYWGVARPVPLEPEERDNFIFKDSVRKADRDSQQSKRYSDSVRRAQRPIQLKDFVIRGISRNLSTPAAKIYYRFDPFLWTHIAYNSVEGFALIANQTLTLQPTSGKKRIDLNWNTRYGFSNHHLNSFATLTVRGTEESSRSRYLRLSGGKQLLQFNRDNPVDPFANAIYTLLYRRNYLKLYEAWFGKAEYGARMENGLQFRIAANYERRLPVQNSANFSFFKKGESLLPNHPYELATVPFNRHSALVASVTLSYQPGQRYIEFPQQKVSVGSRYPTFELRYDKGVPDVFNSTADFDKWKVSVFDEANLKLLGTFKYRISAGGFLNRRHVDIPDFTHFIGNQMFSNRHYVNSFQLAPYYRYSNTEPLYGLLNAEHHFNGLLTNKLPLLNRLKWNLVAGTNMFYVNRNNYYAEIFAGLENIFKIFRVDFIVGTQPQAARSFGVRLGLGGAIGGIISLR